MDTILGKERISNLDTKKRKLLEYQNELLSLEKRVRVLLYEIYQAKMENTEKSAPDIDYFGGRQYQIEGKPKTLSSNFCFIDYNNLFRVTDLKKTVTNVELPLPKPMKTFTQTQLKKDIIKAIIITGFGIGLIATLLFGFKIGLIIGIFSAVLNIHGIYYRNNHYSEYFGNEA